MTDVVIDFANITAGDQVLDLYGGVGLFTSQCLELIGESGRIDLVEGSKSATGDALRNFANFSNVGVHTGDVEKILPRFSKADVIILDPPREGAYALVQALAALHQQPELRQDWTPPKRIVYVSCAPATLARDAGVLVNEAGYTCTKAGVVNMFPHTAHVESIAVFELN